MTQPRRERVRIFSCVSCEQGLSTAEHTWSTEAVDGIGRVSRTLQQRRILSSSSSNTVRLSNDGIAGRGISISSGGDARNSRK